MRFPWRAGILAGATVTDHLCPEVIPMKAARLLAGLALVAALALLSPDGLSGQDKDKRGPESAKTAAKGKLPPGWDRLDLTDAQRAEVIKLMAEYQPKIDELQQELGRLRAELARKRVAVLTDEQKKKLADAFAAEPKKDNSKEKDRPKDKGKADPGERPKEKPKGDPDK